MNLEYDRNLYDKNASKSIKYATVDTVCVFMPEEI